MKKWDGRQGGSYAKKIYFLMFFPIQNAKEKTAHKLGKKNICKLIQYLVHIFSFNYNRLIINSYMPFKKLL